MDWFPPQTLSEFRVPIGDWVEAVIDYLTSEWAGLFDAITTIIEGGEQYLRAALSAPHFIWIALFLGIMVWALVGRRVAAAAVGATLVVWIAGALLGYWPFFEAPGWAEIVGPWLLTALLVTLAGRLAGWKTAAFTLVALGLTASMELWDMMIRTLSLTLTATVIALLLAIPTGVLTAKSSVLRSIVAPILDFMQTMPAYVYLLPAVMLFSIGVTAGVFGTIVFAFAPPVRLTYLGLQQVPNEMVEAADAFGCTPLQKLFKVELPAAMPSIMAGINQCLMLSLSMVVIASLIGAPGLGTEVLRGLTRLLIGRGFEAGLGIVFLAIILDRLIQGAQHSWEERKRKVAA